MSDAQARAEAKKTLLKQAEALGVSVDNRWSVETLAEKVMEAQADSAGREAEAIRKASDTWVYLLRDAFPVADEKHLAGETIRVPAGMAEQWFEAGVARPGKKPEA